MFIFQLLISIFLAVTFIALGYMLLDLYTDDLTKNHAFVSNKKTMSASLAPVLTPIANKIEPLIRLQDIDRAKKVRDLARAGIDQTPERFIANAIGISILLLLLSIPFWLFGALVPAFGLPMVAVVMLRQNLQAADVKLRAKDERIRMALPHFIRTVTENLKVTRDIPDILRKYMADVPDTPLYDDLETLVSRLESGDNAEMALMDFERNINMPECTSFVQAMIQISNGVDQVSHLETINQDMTAMNRENLKRIMNKRPRKLKVVKTAMIFAAVAVMIVPMIMNFISGMAMFN